MRVAVAALVLVLGLGAGACARSVSPEARCEQAWREGRGNAGPSVAHDWWVAECVQEIEDGSR